ncbi:MAG: DbpA RNA binding domain-containing protein, partial [Myxococcales bacterium]|nr:DbpA RNA binding domain-containing protein [Myxococcales bacterium]
TAPRERRERRPRGEDRPRRERDRDRDRDRPRRDANGSNGTAPEPQRALAFESSTGDAPAPAGSDDSFGGDEGDSEFDDSRPRTKLYMNIGKRDGARAGALSRLLRDQCGLEREQIGRIRVRDKHTFIEVEPARADHVVQTLSGTQFEGRDLVVEHARTESAHP